jgi:hypothetical protein
MTAPLAGGKPCVFAPRRGQIIVFGGLVQASQVNIESARSSITAVAGARRSCAGSRSGIRRGQRGSVRSQNDGGQRQEHRCMPGS